MDYGILLSWVVVHSIAGLAGPAPGPFSYWPEVVAARAGAVHGRVTDSSGAPVVAAVVELLPGAAGVGAGAARAGDTGVGGQAGERARGERVLQATTTNADGVYRLAGVEPGSYRLRVRRLGYESHVVELRLGAGELRRVDVVLTLAPVRIDSLVVESALHTRRERARFEADAGVTARVVTSREMKIIPGLAEADVLRAVEVLPGVISTSDFSSAFNVRGGSADQNLILLDGFPIFNPFHLGGLFSVFNSDVLAGAELLAGGFGAEHGGRVSSVLNVESRDYAGTEFGGEAGVSLLATRASLHGSFPVPGESTGGWFVSARRSYFDKVLPPDMGLPYHLTDLQVGLTFGTPGGGQLRLTGYTGDDVLDMSSRDRKPPDPEDDGIEFPRLEWRWGNDLLGARWDQPWGEWVSTLRVGVSRYDEGFGFIDLTGPSFDSRVRQLFAGLELARDLAPGLALRFGGGVDRMRAYNLVEGGGTQFWEQLDRGTLGNAFARLGWRAGDAWLIESGVRLDSWSAEERRSVLSPRLALKRFLGEERELALKLALGRYTQYLHSLVNEDLPFGNQTWVLAGGTIPVVTSDQIQFGVEKYWGEEWSGSVESYYRDFRGLIALNTADDLNDPDDDYLTGTGRSYGLDFQLRKDGGRLSGWTTVSLLKAERTFADLLSGGWDDEPPLLTYSPRFDRRIDIDLVLQLELPGATSFGLRFNYGSGLPYTRPLAQHVWWEYDPVSRRYRVAAPAWGDDAESPPLMVVLGPRNGERYPAYHRADLSLRRTFERRWGKATPYLQVLNVYNRKNPLFYFYDFSRSPATMSGISMFPVLPTIGVEVTF